MLISKNYAILFLFAFLFTILMIFIIASNIYANTPPLAPLNEKKRNNNQRNNNQRNNNN
jgi:hypothetical protein